MWWNNYFQTSVNMGDDPSETFRTYSGHDTEGAATVEAKRWLRWDENQPVDDVAFDELPDFGRRMALHVLRRGAGNLGRNRGLGPNRGAR